MKIGKIIGVCGVGMMVGFSLTYIGLLLEVNGYLAYAVAIFGFVNAAFITSEVLE